MKLAKNMAVSEALLHMLTVTAMLVIVSVLLYGKPPTHSSLQQATKAEASARPVVETVGFTSQPLSSDSSSAPSESR